MKVFRIFVVLLLFLCVRPLGAISYGPISVQEIPLTEQRGERTIHGYVEYRFRISNRDAKTHKIALEMPRRSFGSGSVSLRRSTNTVEVPPGTVVTMRLLQPPVSLDGTNEVRVIIDDRYQEEGTPFFKLDSHFQHYSSHSTDIAHVLSSPSVPPDLRDALRSGVSEKEAEKLETEVELPPTGAISPAATIIAPGTSGAPELVVWQASVPVEEWSDSWLAYTRFDSVALTSGDWRLLGEQHPGVMVALRKYAEAGGTLCVVGTDWNAPEEWLRTESGQTRYNAVLGSAFVMGNTLPEAKSAINPFRDDVLLQSKVWRDAFGDTTRYFHRSSSGGSTTSEILTSDTPLLKSLPVVDNYGVNVKLILVLIVVFAILIGPVNIYVLSLMKRRIWLLWTVPVTSLVASFLVLAVSFLQEGFVRQSSSATYTVLDQRREEAITFGFVGYYSTLTPNGILFSPDTEVTACMDRGYGNSRALELHLVGGGNQYLSRGWISARVPSYFAVRKAESQRKERIAFDWSADPPTATNGLGVNIKNLVVRSPKGSFYRVENISAGEKIALREPESETSKSISRSKGIQQLQMAYRATLTSGPVPTSATSTTGELPDGCYVAEIGVWNPFMELGLDRTTPYKNETTIFGIFE